LNFVTGCTAAPEQGVSVRRRRETGVPLDCGNRLIYKFSRIIRIAKAFNRRGQKMTTPILPLLRASAFFLLASLLACLGSSAREIRKDIIIMSNGDRITGQVKRLQNGLLYVEMPYVSGNIGLDWNQVDSVQTTASFQIVLNNGQRLTGTIEKISREKANNDDFLIREATEEIQVPSTAIANIDSQKPTFWRQLKGNIDFGYSFTSGNNQSALNADSTVIYKARSWGATLSFDSTFGGQTDATSTNREDLQGLFTRYLNRNSFVGGLADFLHSSQQDLTLRTTLGGGYGRFLKRTTNSNLAWLGGVAYINESFDTSTAKPTNQSMEALLALQYNYIRFDLGEFDSQVQIFPGLTDAGRLRITTNNSLSIKLRNNFYLQFTFWDNYDSRPPTTARKNELGTSTGIGWSF
jgi:putative salt-induced outer membrane protein YdiY